MGLDEANQSKILYENILIGTVRVVIFIFEVLTAPEVWQLSKMKFSECVGLQMNVFPLIFSTARFLNQF